MRLLGLRVRFSTFLPAVGLGFALAAACGGSVGGDLGPGGGGTSGGSGGFGAGGGGSGGFFGGGTGGKDAGKDAKQDGTAGFGGSGGFIDEGCPDAEPPPPQFECDPFAQPSDCGFGTGCYPYVIYPQHKCDFETYGTLCAPVGNGKQGDPCLSENCDQGFVCVLTGQGTECVQLCQLTGPDLCPNGLFCLPIDVEGFGGCY